MRRLLIVLVITGLQCGAVLPAIAAPTPDAQVTLSIGYEAGSCILSGSTSWKRVQASRVEFLYLFPTGSSAIGIQGGSYAYTPAKPKGSEADATQVPTGSSADIVARARFYDSAGTLLASFDSSPVTGSCANVAPA